MMIIKDHYSSLNIAGIQLVEWFMLKHQHNEHIIIITSYLRCCFLDDKSLVVLEAVSLSEFSLNRLVSELPKTG